MLTNGKRRHRCQRLTSYRDRENADLIAITLFRRKLKFKTKPDVDKFFHTILGAYLTSANYYQFFKFMLLLRKSKWFDIFKIDILNRPANASFKIC